MAAGIFGNRVTEKDIRNWLDENGFFGRAARISDLELHAIKRPGWKQLFRFTARVKSNSEAPESRIENEELNNPSDGGDVPQVRYGVVLDDQRERTEAQQTQIFLFETIDKRDELLEELSADMLTCSTEHNGDLYVLSIVVIAFLIVSLVLGSLVGN